jgi:predicted TIM-barrel fold metal-dependent hydrolase
MPYREKAKEAYSNYWFSSSNGSDCQDFINLVSPKNIDQLERQNGCAIVYVHFAYGFVDEAGELDENFKQNIAYLARKNGWFAPASTVLDYLKRNQKAEVYLDYIQSLKQDLRWSAERIARKVLGKG